MNKYSIFLIAQKPIFNPEKINMFEKLNKQYAIYLNSLLYFNWIEILSSLEKFFDFYLILNAKDKDFIPKNFIPDSGELILIETEKDEFVNDIFKNLRLVGYGKHIFIFFNSIGIRKEDISKTFDLLSIDDQAVVIGKSIDEKIAFFGTNTGDKRILNNLFSENITYNKLLNILSKEDIFIQTINKFSSINNFKDVKKLYIELSKKDSLSFCSENMHERFNDLFVEYKDLLNE
jgi:hypothetical protein